MGMRPTVIADWTDVNEGRLHGFVFGRLGDRSDKVDTEYADQQNAYG
jgi:hypothetical protein